MIAAPELPNKKGETIAKSFCDALEEWNITQNAKALNFDSTAANTGTISLKGIVQGKGPVALPSSGRNGTIWLSRVYASPEPSFTTGKFGVVVKVLDFHSSGGFDRE